MAVTTTMTMVEHRLPGSSSDPFLATHASEAPTNKPKTKARPASMVLAPLPTFAASVAPNQVQLPPHGAPTTAGVPATLSSTFSLPSPAPFVGTSSGSRQWPATGPTVPPSPLMPTGYSGYGPFAPGLGHTASKDGLRSPLSPLRHGAADDYGFPSVALAKSTDRLSPYPMTDRKPSLDRRVSQRSKLQQLFGKGGNVAGVARDFSPAGFPFPNTPPLTPPYSSADSSVPRLAPSCTPPTQYSPITPPPTASPVSATDGEVSTRALANHTLHPRFAREYRILGELGSGGFGFVVRAIRLSDKRIVAVKFITISKVPSHAWIKLPNWDGGNKDGSRAGEALIPMEAFVLRRVKHEGVVSFIDLFEQGPYFYLVMEHHGTPWVAAEKEKNLTSPCDLPALAAAANAVPAAPSSDDSMQLDDLSSSPTPVGRTDSPSPPKPAAPPMLRRASCDLFECIEQHKRLPEDTARYVFHQVCSAVHHLLKLGVCHRDLKDENIVIDKQYRVKLIDFGSAVMHDPRTPPPYYNRFWGTMNFASAEILASQPYRAPQAEVWALGVLLCLLVLGETPFSSVERAREGRPTANFNGISRDCVDLIMRCLVCDPDERITVDEMLQHPWLASGAYTLSNRLNPRSLLPMARAASFQL